MVVNDKIRHLRELKHWSQEEMAEKLEISTNSYARLERGEGKLDLEKLEKIAAVFDITVSKLIETDDKILLVQQIIGDNSSYSNNIGECEWETEKLKLMLQHKDELMLQKDNEISALKEVISLLKQQANK
ncbi:helix-turn-helix domain-containing protein [Conchiformibius kuhniae]|uniref:Helix-turn-helix domain-containing protein n=1 Tax=Conchiformibius kuhniae TaxID=211502 RepID=A0A8T9MSC9_9NEIS|nr:helix-turn-helix transcriptional regulator [Conchiformibius kuhniae]UOP04517.1 helix-turn-helix domain-containing protein [Conchiformibius kuhniae]